jgi:hypothetical protein
MAAGFTLNLLSVNVYLAYLIIAITTGVSIVLGAYIGRQSGTWLGRSSRRFGVNSYWGKNGGLTYFKYTFQKVVFLKGANSEDKLF